MTSAELTFIGTATVLVRMGPFTYLTDPNFLHAGDHAPLGWGLRSRRLTEPAMELEDLPPLDFVLLSHHHGDHFDPLVVERLPKSTRIVTEPGSAKKLHRQGFDDVVALATWETVSFTSGPAELHITATPGRHAPTVVRWALPEVMGSLVCYVIGGKERHRTYVTGDTLFFEGLSEVLERGADIDLCILHLGGTRIAGLMLTMDGDQGVRLLELLEPREVLPVHYDDYTVFRSPLSDFVERFERAGLATVLKPVERGVPSTISLRTSPHADGQER
jgi:L-ascorbate metabolism protein UlaG (beta-lactamase superfamily)